ncbi:MAG: hypothetical protein J0L55_04330 [Caulobacterales bacterium]|nr:hypothetical protein [Caulobacterales bacterium]MCA0372114.1 SAM-dependent methyltransferase [Pseudomonadota bacterium]
MSDLFVFLKSWSKNPNRIGAIAPSGNSLGALITKDISPNKGKVLELGPGTGVFTNAILNKGIKEEDLILIEADEDLAKLLSPRFPNVKILNINAARLHTHNELKGEKIGAAISGLPLLLISPRKTMQILMGVFKLLPDNGALYQFTYGPKCPIPKHIIDRLGLKAKRIGFTIANIPPASVYKITRRKPINY